MKATLFTCLLALPNLSFAAPEANPRPNILFIVIDDLNDWITPLGGHPQSITPNLERLAKRGILFSNAYCSSPACKPSRAAVMSGLSPYDTDVFWNKGPGITKKVKPKDLLPGHLAAQGYETLGTGKIFHGGGGEHFQKSFKTEQRWSPFTRAQAKYSEADLPSKGSANPRHKITDGPGGKNWTLPLNGLPSERNPQKRDGESFDWGPLDIADDEMGDTQITDWSIARLKEDRPKPFFLATGYYRPHIPLFAPEKDFAAYPPDEKIKLPKVLANDLDDLSEAAKKWALEPITAGSHPLVLRSGQWKSAVRAYLACVTYVDREVGRLVDQLDASPHAANTWIIIWSDHGWHLGEKQHWGKWTGWRESARVPLIIIPPAGAKGFARGKTCHQAVSLLDLYPSILDFCALPERKNLAGQSLLPLLKKPDTQTDRIVPTIFDRGNLALSSQHWRYLRYKDGSEELYHLQKDPHEWHNLANDPKHADKLAHFRKEVPKHLRSE